MDEQVNQPVMSTGDGEAALDRRVVTVPLIGIEVERQAVPWLIAAVGAILLLGWSFLQALPAVWFNEEGYYSHGLLIPFMTAGAIYLRRDKIRQEPVTSSPGGLILMIVGLLMLTASRLIDNLSLSAIGFIVTLIGGVYFAFGKRVARHCIGPLLFLIFMMPVLGWIIDSYTNPLQRISTVVAAKMMNVVGLVAEIPEGKPTTIHMNSYPLLIGGPCSGFKLILSLAAFTAFFIMISNLNWKRSLILAAIAVPLAIFINGLRIMLVGVVGEAGVTSPGNPFIAFLRRFGEDPGMVFHDYSGYITLIVCFVILHYIVKALEGKKTHAVST